MRKKKFLFSKIIICIVLVVIAIILEACFHSEEYNHYKEKDKFIIVEGTIVHILNQEEKKKVILEVENLTHSFSDICFKIVGENYDLIYERELINELSINDEISFHTIPGYLGDGYVYPIASIEVNGVTYLEFEEGYENLMEYYR